MQFVVSQNWEFLWIVLASGIAWSSAGKKWQGTPLLPLHLLALLLLCKHHSWTHSSMTAAVQCSSSSLRSPRFRWTGNEHLLFSQQLWQKTDWLQIIPVGVARGMGTLIVLGVTGPFRVGAHPKLMDCKWGRRVCQRGIRIRLPKEEENECWDVKN